jgi:hypothetical protein
MACKFHSVMSLTGVIMGFFVTPASPYDKQVLVEPLDSCSHHLTHLLGDGAFNDAAIQSFLEQYRGLQLLAPTKVNQSPKRSQQAQRQRGRLRLICETFNAQRPRAIAPVQTLCAIRTWGFLTRIAASVTAHSLGMMVNALCGRPLLRLADLAV